MYKKSAVFTKYVLPLVSQFSGGQAPALGGFSLSLFINVECAKGFIIHYKVRVVNSERYPPAGYLPGLAGNVQWTEASAQPTGLVIGYFALERGMWLRTD